MWLKQISLCVKSFQNISVVNEGKPELDTPTRNSMQKLGPVPEMQCNRIWHAAVLSKWSC